ncbi:MAG: hypothetical protein AMDU4_FER2C00027G0022 [Ferroplasma sp. Type II]|nr:MAG: hypothetical protein AMDU4_FER2C00027G0022 [Ferroplasma sp. Type II]
MRNKMQMNLKKIVFIFSIAIILLVVYELIFLIVLNFLLVNVVSSIQYDQLFTDFILYSLFTLVLFLGVRIALGYKYKAHI